MAALVEGNVEGGDVGVAAEHLGVPGNVPPVQQGEDTVGSVAAPDAEDALNGGVGKGVLEVLGSLGVIGGKISVSVYIIARRIDHRIQAKSLHRLDGRLQSLFWHSGGGAEQGYPRAGV